MKKAASILLILAMILTSVTALAGEAWFCPDCGQKNESNFCSNCGARRPDGGSGGSSSASGMRVESVSPGSDGSVTISWSGGQAPYKIQYEWFVNDNYNAGVDVTLWNAVDNLYSTSTTLKGDLVPGERYWVIVNDANGNSTWYDYQPRRETFTKISGTNLVMSLRIVRNKRASTVGNFDAGEIEREYLSTTFGATIKMNLGKRQSSLACMLRFAMFLPNGEPIMFACDNVEIPGYWPDCYWETYDMKGLWTTIMQVKNSIPSGRYTFRLYVDNTLFGQHDFSIN